MDNGTEIVTENNVESRGLKQKSLLAKYEIPIDDLSYEYIRGCNNVKRLERIVKILRSGEEGIFPDLQKTAEERLRELSPDNRHLQKEEPALSRSCFNRKEWKNIWDDIEDWKKEVSNREKQLCKGNDCELSVTVLPPVRHHVSAKQTSEKTKNKLKPKVKISDYAFWEKYDVDTELLKMDVEEEKKNAVQEKLKCVTQTGQDRIELVMAEAPKLSETEKLVFAEKEKTRGNEYYRAKDYVEAEKRYTASLAIHPTANAYNNRAECFIKQGKYPEAIQDAENVLELDPNNIKALFRKGIALKHEGEFNAALQCIDRILKQEPNHSQAQHVEKQLKESIQTTIKSDLRNCKPTENQFFSEGNRCFEVNEWGLPKIICQCQGSLKICKSQPALVSNVQGRTTEKKPGNVRIIELSDTYEQPKPTTSTKFEIIEIEKPHQAPRDDLCRPVKCNIVDKRTVKKGFGYGGGDVM